MRFFLCRTALANLRSAEYRYPMCYSALVEQNLKTIARKAKARVDIDSFAEAFARRAAGEDVKLAKALEANFLVPESAAEKRIAADIRAFQTTQAEKWEAELFKQKRRLSDAERLLKSRITKKAEEDRRIAGNKIDWLLKKLANLKRRESQADDGRIFPFWYAPVVVEENGERLIRPMRYHLRAHGKPAGTDHRYPGLYNARRDNLEGYWKSLFGRRHAVCLVLSFYENVARHDFEKRELRFGEKPENLVLHFNPQPATTMFVACLWDRWQKPGEPDLCSFAAITDDPPPEVAATGHNRCIIPLKTESLGGWLSPGPDLATSYALLDDRERPYYAHELAA
jgi:putative SOS response-associated peptidase YedK